MRSKTQTVQERRKSRENDAGSDAHNLDHNLITHSFRVAAPQRDFTESLHREPSQRAFTETLYRRVMPHARTPNSSLIRARAAETIESNPSAGFFVCVADLSENVADEDVCHVFGLPLLCACTRSRWNETKKARSLFVCNNNPLESALPRNIYISISNAHTPHTSSSASPVTESGVKVVLAAIKTTVTIV